MNTKTQVLQGGLGLPNGQLRIVPIAVSQAMHYARACFTGNTAFPVDGKWSQVSILDLLVQERDPLMERFWHPEIQKQLPGLGWSGHLIRLWDSCLRIGLAPDPRFFDLDMEITHPEYWPTVLAKLVEMIVKIIQINKNAIVQGGINDEFDRVYLRILVYDSGLGVGPRLPDWRHPVPASMEIIAQPFHDHGRLGATLVPALSQFQSPVSRIKTPANYLALQMGKFQGLQEAAEHGIQADDVYNFLHQGLHGWTLGESSTATIGVVFYNDNHVNLVVPDPEVSGTLPGLTAAWAIKLARELGYTANYGPVDLSSFTLRANEAFLAGNATGIKHVGHINSRELQQCVITQIAARYAELVSGKIHAKHLTLVDLS